MHCFSTFSFLSHLLRLLVRGPFMCIAPLFASTHLVAFAVPYYFYLLQLSTIWCLAAAGRAEPQTGAAARRAFCILLPIAVMPEFKHAADQRL